MKLRAIVVVMAVAVALMLVPGAFAQSPVQVVVQEVESAEGVLVADVLVNDVTDLYGLEFRINYDPSVVTVRDASAEQDGVQIEPGAFFPAEDGFVVVNQADASTGTIAYALTLLNPAPPVSGSGSLARITFDVLQESGTTIELEQVNLVSGDLEIIPAETTSLQIGGGFPWWLVAMGVFMVGLVALGAVVLMAARQPQGDKKDSRPEPVQPQAEPKQRVNGKQARVKVAK